MLYARTFIITIIYMKATTLSSDCLAKMLGFEFESWFIHRSSLPRKLQELKVLWAISVTLFNNEETFCTWTSPGIKHYKRMLYIYMLVMYAVF